MTAPITLGYYGRTVDNQSATWPEDDALFSSAPYDIYDLGICLDTKHPDYKHEHSPHLLTGTLGALSLNYVRYFIANYGMNAHSYRVISRHKDFRATVTL